MARRLRIGSGDIAAPVEREAAIGCRCGTCARFEVGHDGAAVEAAGRALAPLDDERIGATPRVPPGAADDGQRGGRAGVGAEAHDALDAGERERGRDVDRAGAAADHRTVADRGVEQAGRPHVDAKRAEPLLLATTSMRGAAVPIKRQSARAFRRTSPVGVAAAMRASSP